MPRGPLILWLLTLLWRLHLTPAAAETVVTAFLGQPATLPCYHQSWSANSNSMCWGKGPCPNSKCTDELLYTDGARVLSRKSTKYDIQGYIRGGDISLTIFNTKESDSAVYCCRIEVPGWFNDIKKNIRLQVRKAPMTTRRPTTRRPTTTTTTTTTIAMTTTTVTPPTTVLTTSDLPTTPPLQTRPTTALTVATTTCPLEAPSTLPEATKSLPTTEPATEEPVFTAESETSFLPKATSGDTPRGSETTTFEQIKVEKNQTDQVGGSALLKIVAFSLAFVLGASALIFAFYRREKVMKTNCFHKHTRLDEAGGSKRSVLDDDIQHEREDEDGLFTL
ncbi:T-cell immunoglobulin and mucin domain-containing protein 4-like isoform X2 [Phyllostomus hastatus]|uniref:T-cell immunoglobulin and mucin domain-containing protein 4-like isoform X2 n=1 Tax=Phyllostomus hastatus TaxID=9423 RepID=UPI001E684505|nr:T-cell immunoglobulin and mucin domain-containing protein 4-like isoform X2 [Phyllostomus hastatus]